MKKYVIEILRKSCIDRHFVKSFSKLTAGTASAQLVSIITVPILTRLYGVEAYGIQAVYNSVVSIVFILATGRYETAILLPKDDKQSFSVCCIVILLSLAMSICWFLGYMVVKDEVITFFGYGEVFDWLQWLPFTVMATSLSVVVTHWLNRMKDYNMMAKIGVLASMVNFVFAFVYAYLFYGDNFGLYFNTFVGNLFVASIFIFYCHKKRYFCFSWVSFRGLFNVAKLYSDMPRYMVGGSILNDLSNRLPIFLLQGFAGEAVVGWYAMGLKLLGMPLQLVATAVGNVFIRDAAEEWNEKKSCWNSFKKTFVILFATGVIPNILIFFYSCDVFVFFLGAHWYMSGVYCAYLVPMYFIKFIYSPLSGILLIANKQKEFLYTQLCSIVVVYMGMKLGYSLFGTIDIVIILYGLSLFTYYSLVLVYCCSIAHNRNLSI